MTKRPSPFRCLESCQRLSALISPDGLTGLLFLLVNFHTGAAPTGLHRIDKGNPAMSLTLTSASFQHKDMIPFRHTCDGSDLSPQLSWTGVPVNAKSLVLIADDPDAPDPKAPKMTWVHWVLYNIPPNAHDLPEGVAAKNLPAGTLQGTNDWRRIGYGGPCPPIGKHRYFHKLFALDARLPDLGNPDKKALEKAMQGHVLAHTELIGLYERRTSPQK